MMVDRMMLFLLRACLIAFWMVVCFIFTCHHLQYLRQGNNEFGWITMVIFFLLTNWSIIPPPLSFTHQFNHSLILESPALLKTPNLMFDA